MHTSPTTRNYNRYPMLILSVSFALGIVIQHTHILNTWTAVAMACVVVLFCGVMRSFSLLIPVAFIFLGATCYEIELRSVADDRVKKIYSDGRIESHEPVEIEGTLLGIPEPALGGSFITLSTERLVHKRIERPVSGNVRLFAPESDALAAEKYARLELGYGSQVRVACRLDREERFLNPGVASSVAILDQQGIDAVATIKSPLLVEKIGERPVFIPIAWAYEQRQWLIERFRENYTGRTAGVMIASLLGDKHFLDRETADVFREGGTFHVLVISGLHITFIGALTLWGISFLTKRLLWQSVLASSFLWMYTLAVGGGVPVVRASVMFSILLLAKAMYRQSSLLNSFGLCALLLLVWRPSDLFSASFQLTVVSVGAIVGCAFPLIEKLREIGRWTPTTRTPLPTSVRPWLRRLCELLYWNEAAWRIDNRRQIWSANLFKSPYLRILTAPNLQSVIAYLFEGILVSLIVQIWMLPLLVIYFHRISFAGVILNLWVGLFLALESFAAIAGVLVASVSSWLAAPLITLTELLNAAMLSLPALFSRLDVAGYRLPVYSGYTAVIYLLYGCGVVLASASLFKWDPFLSGDRRAENRYRIASLLILAVLGSLIIFHPFSSPTADGRLKIDFLDVGQGDSALITFPTGETMLVDGGGKVDYGGNGDGAFEPDAPRIGETVVSEFLWEKGYSKLDYVVATHADADHIQGLVDVVRNFSVGTFIVGELARNDRDLEEVLAAVERYDVPLRILNRGATMAIGGVEVRVMNPTDSFSSSASLSSNNGSLVLHLAFGARAVLLTGDIERSAETELVSNFGTELKADVVKVPHHGSKTSSTYDFVDLANARMAVISVGRRSRFGHPHPEVVRRWKEFGAEVFTTGERGTVTVETNGDDLLVRTFTP